MTFPTVPLSDVLLEARAGFASGDDLEDGIFQIRMNNLSRRGGLVLDKRRRVSPNNKQVKRALLEPGDVLFNATNSPDLVGKTAYFTGCDEPAVYSNHFIRLRPRSEVLDARFLTRWLQREFERGHFKANCNQWVNQATFGKDRLEAMQVPLPPLDEQRRIAEVLDATDAIRDTRRQALAKVDTLTQAVFIDMFGGSQSFPIAKLGEKVPTTSGGTPSRSKQEYFSGDIPWVKSGELAKGLILDTEERITSEAVAHSSAKLMSPGTVLLAMYGATVGAVATLGIEAATNQAICCLSPTSEITGPYLSGFLRSVKPELLRRAAGGAQPNISQSIIRDLDLPLPPLALQHVYFERVAGVAVLRDRSAVSSSQLDDLFASLQQKAFRGEL